MLTHRQKNVLDFIQSEQRGKGITPSTREIQKHFRFASQTSSLDARSANISKNGRIFALRVRGDSMIGAHIVDGDIVILEDRKDVQNDDIVAGLIDGETTLKRYVVEHGRPYLKAENPRYPDLMPARELRIQGIMVSLVRKQERKCH